MAGVAAASAAAPSKSCLRVKSGIGLDISWALRWRPEQHIPRSSAGEHAEEFRYLRIDFQPGVLILIDDFDRRDRAIEIAGELLNGALVKRFVLLVCVPGFDCRSSSCAIAYYAADDSFEWGEYGRPAS
jgi:hypothetical protein